MKRKKLFPVRNPLAKEGGGGLEGLRQVYAYLDVGSMLRGEGESSGEESGVRTPVLAARRRFDKCLMPYLYHSVANAQTADRSTRIHVHQGADQNLQGKKPLTARSASLLAMGREREKQNNTKTRGRST